MHTLRLRSCTCVRCSIGKKKSFQIVAISCHQFSPSVAQAIFVMQPPLSMVHGFFPSWKISESPVDHCMFILLDENDSGPMRHTPSCSPGIASFENNKTPVSAQEMISAVNDKYQELRVTLWRRCPSLHSTDASMGPPSMLQALFRQGSLLYKSTSYLFYSYKITALHLSINPSIHLFW